MKIDNIEYDVLMERRGEIENGEKDLLYYLLKRIDNDTYWESRPLYNEEHRHYSGGPMEYVKVTKEYVKAHYHGVIKD